MGKARELMLPNIVNRIFSGVSSGIVGIQAILFLVWQLARCFDVCDQVINNFVDKVRSIESVTLFHPFHKDWYLFDHVGVSITFPDRI
jgi:hypothetical protein